MGQGIGRVPEAPAVGGDDGGREPIGRYIAQQRRLRGIELEELATRTRIPRRSLERLEAGAFDLSPDGFSRGFVRTVAEAIGLDPDDAVARMLPEPDPARHASPRPGRVLGALAGLALLAGVALAVRALIFLPSAPVDLSARGELPVRRDFVRALAAAQGIDAAALTARAAILAPLPAESEVPPAIAEADAVQAAPARPQPRAQPATTTPSATATTAAATLGAPAPSAQSLPLPELEAAGASPERAPEAREPTPPASASIASETHTPAAAIEGAATEAEPLPAPSPDAEAHD